MKGLNIVITVDPEIPVPPTHYGGIERVVDMLIRGLAARGHSITLFAHDRSQTPARMIPYKGSKSIRLSDTINNAFQVCAYVKKEKPDIVHSFSRLAYLFFILSSSIPKIQSYQRHITPRSIFLGTALGRNTLTFTACSRYCAGTAHAKNTNWIIIPNGVPLERYIFKKEVTNDAPLVFLGRIERIKGAHNAIACAKKAGKRLIIAGSHETWGTNHEYFKDILSQCDGEKIQHIGPVDDHQKNELLSNAAALLFPIEWDEPFGIVMTEALACGTPVIAFNRGAVKEIIADGQTGFICDTRDEMTQAIRKISEIDRQDCRLTAERSFSDTVIVSRYEALYLSLTQNDQHIKEKTWLQSLC